MTSKAANEEALNDLCKASLAFAASLERLSAVPDCGALPLREHDFQTCLTATHALMAAAKAHYAAEKEKPA
jgi:hypothetical protein